MHRTHREPCLHNHRPVFWWRNPTLLGIRRRTLFGIRLLAIGILQKILRRARKNSGEIINCSQFFLPPERSYGVMSSDIDSEESSECESCSSSFECSDGAVCAICQEDLLDQNRPCIRIDGCHHAFHAECACRWFREGHPHCPLCRANPTLEPMHALTRSHTIRRFARSSSAPKELKRLGERMRNAEQKKKTAFKEIRSLRQRHKNVYKSERRLSAQHRRWSEKCHEIRMEIGLYHCEAAPLPPLRIINRF